MALTTQKVVSVSDATHTSNSLLGFESESRISLFLWRKSLVAFPMSLGDLRIPQVRRLTTPPCLNTICLLSGSAGGNRAVSPSSSIQRRRLSSPQRRLWTASGWDYYSGESPCTLKTIEIQLWLPLPRRGLSQNLAEL